MLKRYAVALSFALVKSVPPAFGDEAAAMQKLEILSRFEIPKAAAQAGAMDARWASKDSIYLGYRTLGVFEVEVGKQLREVREVFPPGSRGGAATIQNVFNVAATDDYVLAWSVANEVGWRETSSESQVHVKRMLGWFDDMDVSGDKVAILGYPGVQDFGDSDFAYLWIGDLSDELTQWRPIRELSVPTAGHARKAFGRLLGSLRFLPNGDLIVVPFVKPGVFLHSQAGKVKASWTPEQLEGSLRGDLGLKTAAEPTNELSIMETAPPKSGDEVLKHLESLRIVILDVVPVGKKPGVLVRYGAGASTGFYLGVLADEIQWYKLPLQSHPATARIRADALEKGDKLVVLATGRGAPDEGTKAQIYVLRLP
jgi:hypothetical protein